jgi:type II secretion system protein H
MKRAARLPRDNRKRRSDAGLTLIETLVVLVIVGVMASVIGLSVSGGNRSAAAIEREATLLSVRLERASNSAMLNGTPAGFIWDTDGYGFLSFQDGAWAAHPDGVLGAPHRLDQGVVLAVDGQRQGQYLMRSDMLPSKAQSETGQLLAMQVAFSGADETVAFLFDGVSATNFGSADVRLP